MKIIVGKADHASMNAEDSAGPKYRGKGVVSIYCPSDQVAGLSLGQTMFLCDEDPEKKIDYWADLTERRSLTIVGKDRELRKLRSKNAELQKEIALLKASK